MRKSFQRLFIFSLALQGLAVSEVSAVKKNPNTDWLKDSKYGVMSCFLDWVHFEDDEWQKLVNAFDVKAVVAQLEEMGAGYILLSMGQNRGHYCAPSKVFTEITGYAPGTKCSTRDLPMELSKALEGTGIRLMLYLPPSPANGDYKAKEAFGFNPKEGNPPLNRDNAAKWAKLMKEWSDRYGDRVSGWWIDGCYGHRFESRKEAAVISNMFADALRSGNPKSILTFNKLGDEDTDAADYLAGEHGGFSPRGRWHQGLQYQRLLYTGDGWGLGKPKHETSQIVTWAKQIIGAGGAFTFDIAPALAHNMRRPVGTFSPESVHMVKSVRAAIRGDIPVPAPLDTSRRPFPGPEAGQIPGVIEIENFDYGLNGEVYSRKKGRNSGFIYRDDRVDIRTIPEGDQMDNNDLVVSGLYSGDWWSYTVDVRAGAYEVSVESILATEGAEIEMLLDDRPLGTVKLENTGRGWSRSLTTFPRTVQLPEGKGRILTLRYRFDGTRDGTKLNKIVFRTR